MSTGGDLVRRLRQAESCSERIITNSLRLAAPNVAVREQAMSLRIQARESRIKRRATTRGGQARDDNAAGTVLHQSLLPSALPVIEGMEMAARYIPGTGTVGGDWYDTFILPARHLGVVIGDVVGSGQRAAAMMGRIRSTLRAYALETRDPAETLGRLDRKIQHFAPDAMATVTYAVFGPALDQADISSAGHLPPVLAVPGEPVKPADIAEDPVIGCGRPVRRTTTTVNVSPGSLLCLYTDGLVERRDEPIDEGIARLCQAVGTGSPATVCSAVMRALVGAAAVHDDIALLVLRRARLPSFGIAAGVCGSSGNYLSCMPAMVAAGKRRWPRSGDPAWPWSDPRGVFWSKESK